MYSTVRGKERTKTRLMKILILLSLFITLATAFKINSKRALAQLIVSQIKVHIQSDLVANISASVSDKQTVVNGIVHMNIHRSHKQ